MRAWDPVQFLKGANINMEILFVLSVLCWTLARHGRDLHAKGAFSSLPSGDGLGASAVRTVGFAIQMLMAYFIMVRGIPLLIFIYSCAAVGREKRIACPQHVATYQVW